MRVDVLGTDLRARRRWEALATRLPDHIAAACTANTALWAADRWQTQPSLLDAPPAPCGVLESTIVPAIGVTVLPDGYVDTIYRCGVYHSTVVVIRDGEVRKTIVLELIQ